MSEDFGNRLAGADFSLAEMTGADGAYVFPERILQQIWLRGDFAHEGLRLRDGRKLRIIKRGRWNRLPGPDFKDAEFNFGELDSGGGVRGDVEVHLKAKDWEHHGHAADAAYRNVVLHVVLFPSTVVATGRGDGFQIPILELLPLLEQDLEAFVEEAAMERLASRPYSRLREVIVSESPERLRSEVARHAALRWSAKVALARRRIELLGWDEACHRRALEVLGYRPNRDAMLMVAESWPLQDWLSGSARPEEIWASMKDRWVNSGVRPANSPKRRLEQYGKWIEMRPDWPMRLAQVGAELAKCGENLQRYDLRHRRRTVRLAEWRKRLAVEVTGNQLGGTRFDSMVCDAWLPLLAAREQVESASAGLEMCWRDWWTGDSPAELIKLAREFGDEQTLGGGLGQGTVQGFLGWLADLLDRAGRGT